MAPTVPKQRGKPTLRDIETAALLMRGKYIAYNGMLNQLLRQENLARAAGQYDAAQALWQMYRRYRRKTSAAHGAMCRLASTYNRRVWAANPRTAMARFDALWTRLEWTPAGKAAE